jgi:cobalt-zinc-cadmium efflux system protein
MTSGHEFGRGDRRRKLQVALGLTSGFLIVEIVGGLTSRSLALLADAAHMFTDVAVRNPIVGP